MALFCSPCKLPILCTKSQINCAIQTPFTSKTSISKTSNSEITKNSICASAKSVDTFIQTAKCRSSLSSPGELDKDASSSVIIFIKGLAQSTSEGSLMAAFSRFGEVSRVKVIRHKQTKQSLGFAYVWFIREEHAQAAVDEMNGEFFKGRFVNVSLARLGSCKTRPNHSPYKF
ncbi:hypothetical protein DH2020_035945 [Rehmannia glutinosa]|uniref:RRM domain-containing protein n=1 Tax=Rehmannia glutinosa TaxID=99300 RepID=A0ABR0V5C1_REHGL